ncbi:MAG: acetyl-CoA carboxylase, biotin carboxyl carrier protein [Verrucomicrobiaceae bacterium TMED86]|nr:MAG: acetyl-CoA carboxylase, biotin carboxyl carrier protein [Verrucomicrobiaceae bacterium TMED86]
MDLTEIKKIVKLMDDHGLSQFQYEKEDFNLKLKKGVDIDEIQSLLGSLGSAPAPVAPIAAPAAPAAPAAESAAPEPVGEEVSSPMVGTFYRKSSPESPNFVEVGDAVSEGQTLCIIEAMKVMNEIKAEKSGTIAQVCVDDGNSVQFGDALFRLQ